MITHDIAARFAQVALGHIGREYPNKLDHVLHGPEDLRSPRELHPIFYGSFDWHSCVHAHWMLAFLGRRFPDLRPDAVFDERFTAANVAGELAYVMRPSSRGFERPYGWAWLLKLAHDLEEPWKEALAPLTAAFVDRFLDVLPRATYPIRTGTHFNWAFAIVLAHEYAEGAHPELAHALREKAIAWYGEDTNCPAWEPGADDFLSPALVEAECMRRVLSATDFRVWLARFLPGLAEGEPRALFEPATVSDRTDGKTAHLDGLNLSRAWCFSSLAKTLPNSARLEAAAASHRAASLPHVTGDYAGQHWLATFAVLALQA